MKCELILKINDKCYKHKYYKQVDDSPGNGCNACALNDICGLITWDEPICGGKHFEEFEIEPTKEIIKKVLRLSDEAELSSEERIKFIKDNWNEETKK